MNSSTKNSHFFIRDAYFKQQQTDLSRKSLSSLSDTKAENTIDAYESDWDDFCDWCRFHQQPSFPASSATIVNYINDLADNAKISTIRRRISAISENFNAAGLADQNPCKEWIVREALIGLNRRIGSAQQGKTPIYWQDLEKMIGLMDLTKLAGVRDKAILLLGFMGAFRRSEISGLDVQDIFFFPQGAVITITHSKTDQLSAGQQVGIPYLENREMCAVSALSDWIKKAELSEGPLFRSLTRAGKPSGNRLSDKSINLLIKKYAALIGLNPALYGAHSLRHGFATSAALNGIEERLIMKQTRHRSVEMVRHYINEADLFTNNPISMMFKTIGKEQK